jgi:hypothetical protein
MMGFFHTEICFVALLHMLCKEVGLLTVWLQQPVTEHSGLSVPLYWFLSSIGPKLYDPS